VEHGSVDQLRRLLKLDAAGIAEQIRETLERLRTKPAGPETGTTPLTLRPKSRAS